MIKGTDVTLYERTQTGVDEFNAPVYTEAPTVVSNVLVAPATPTDIVASTQLYGKQASYTLYIPKGDTHTWEDNRVAFNVGGINYEGRAFICVDAYIEDMVPGEWNKQVMVEHYEQ